MSKLLSCSFILVALIATVFCEQSLFAEQKSLFEYMEGSYGEALCLKSNFTVRLSDDHSYTVKIVNAFYVKMDWYPINVDQVQSQLKGVDLEFFHLFLNEMRNFHLFEEREMRHFKVRVSEGDIGLRFVSSGASQKNASDALKKVLEIARYMIQLNETGRFTQTDSIWESAKTTARDALDLARIERPGNDILFNDPEELAKQAVFRFHLFSSASKLFIYHIWVPLFESTCTNPSSFNFRLSTNDMPDFYRVNRYSP